MRASNRGFTLIELLVALAIGMVLTLAATVAYLNLRTGVTRQEQLSETQSAVKNVFDTMAGEIRMVSHFGCYTGSPTVIGQSGIASDLAGNFAVGLTGFESANATANEYTIAAINPADITDDSKWRVNDGTSYNTISTTLIGGASGITPGSDVLITRTVAANPSRLVVNSLTGSKLLVERNDGGKCADGSVRKGGLCENSIALVAGCKAANILPVTSIATSVAGHEVTFAGGYTFALNQYRSDQAEVFPLQTSVYYIKRSSPGDGTSLYRRIFDGTVAAGVESELIAGVENMQVRFGRDTTTPTADGVIDDYVTADDVDDWGRVVAARVSLIVRNSTVLDGDTAIANTAIANGVTITFPATPKIERRVFTTTIAVRNKISYF